MRRLALCDLNDSVDPSSSCLALQTHLQLKREDAGRSCFFVPQYVGILKADPSPAPAFSLSKLLRSCRKVYVMVIAGRTPNPRVLEQVHPCVGRSSENFWWRYHNLAASLPPERRRRSDVSPVVVAHLELCS